MPTTVLHVLTQPFSSSIIDPPTIQRRPRLLIPVVGGLATGMARAEATTIGLRVTLQNLTNKVEEVGAVAEAVEAEEITGDTVVIRQEPPDPRTDIAEWRCSPFDN